MFYHKIVRFKISVQVISEQRPSTYNATEVSVTTAKSTLLLAAHHIQTCLPSIHPGKCKYLKIDYISKLSYCY